VAAGLAVGAVPGAEGGQAPSAAQVPGVVPELAEAAVQAVR